MLDKILNFLFRTRRGNVVLALVVLMSASIFSGCYIFDLPACVMECAGCECAANTLENIDSSFNGCVLHACGADETNPNHSGCAIADCLFGDGCQCDCGSKNCDSCGIIYCGGFNRTMFQSWAGCNGCDCEDCDDCDAVVSCLNCTFSCDEDYNKYQNRYPDMGYAAPEGYMGA